MLNLTEVLLACRVLSTNESCAKLDCYVSPSQSFLGGWFSSWKDCFEEEEQKVSLKLKHIEIGGSEVNFFASCLNYLNVSSTTQSGNCW